MTPDLGGMLGEAQAKESDSYFEAVFPKTCSLGP